MRWTWRVKLLTHLQTDLLGQLRERAEREAIQVFADNLKDLLLAAPAGPRATIGLDPGLRTGVKVAVVDANGKVLEHGAIYPHEPRKHLQEAEATLLHMIRRHRVELIAIGNGTAGRETDKFVGDLLRAHPELAVRKAMVNESGASIYSASEFAAGEFPDLDVTIRGAVSIARRLQDPLAELVKIDPKSIGVGQYQHDVSQVQLATATGQRGGGLRECGGRRRQHRLCPFADQRVRPEPEHRRKYRRAARCTGQIHQPQRIAEGSPHGREDLRAGGRLPARGGRGQPAGRVRGAPGVLPGGRKDRRRQQRDVGSLIGDTAFLRPVDPADYTTDNVGLPTVKDIIAELAKPGRDPRGEFKMAAFQEGVEKISDLVPDMILEGTVTNVTAFGAFVDIGVHQDGLVHISALAERFVKDPRDVVKAGDIVRVKVMEIDQPRKRIGLSMRLSDKAGDQAVQRGPTPGRTSGAISPRASTEKRPARQRAGPLPRLLPRPAKSASR